MTQTTTKYQCKSFRPEVKYLTFAVFTLELGNRIPVERISLVHVEETVSTTYLGTADRL